jgi:hypothetical protein
MRADQFEEDMLLRDAEPLVRRRISLSEPQELIDLLSPAGPLYKRGDAEDLNWIFRGQGNAEWNLAPSAHRGDRNLGRYKFTPEIGWPRSPLTHEKRTQEEFSLIVRFADGAERAGYEIPGDSPLLRDHDTPGPPLTCSQFPPVPWRWIAALAQHSGVPTRLLDWSYNFLAACFFAARGPAREIRRVGQTTEGTERATTLKCLSKRHFAVWALSRAFVDRMLSAQEPGAILVTAPTVSNPNLQRQQGLFTLVRYQKEPPDWRGVPALIICWRDSTKSTFQRTSVCPHAMRSTSSRCLGPVQGGSSRFSMAMESTPCSSSRGWGGAEEHLQDQASYTYG